MEVDWQQFAPDTEFPKRPVTELDIYTRYYIADVEGIEGNDHYIYMHYNGLGIVGLSPKNFVIQQHVKNHKNPLYIIPPKPPDENQQEQKMDDDQIQQQQNENKQEQKMDVDQIQQQQKEIKQAQKMDDDQIQQQQNEIKQEQKMEDDQIQQQQNEIKQEQKMDDEQQQQQQSIINQLLSSEQIVIDYAVSGTDFSEVQQTGKSNIKHRKSGQFLGRKGPALCKVSIGQQEVNYNIQVKCKLLEANHRLHKNPLLLVEYPCTEGFLAIVQVDPNHLKDVVSKFLTPQQYCQKRGLQVEDLY